MKKVKLLLGCLIIAFSIYLILPFINGLGCNFTFQAKGEHITQIGKCKAGVLTTFYQVPGYGKSSYNRYVYGTLGNTSYLIRINKERLEQRLSHESVKNSFEDHYHMFSLYDGDMLYINKNICIIDGKCLVITGNPIENVYEMTYEGNLSFVSHLLGNAFITP